MGFEIFDDQSLGASEQSQRVSYQRALAVRPDYPQAHNNLGNLLKDMDRYDDARRHYERAIALAPAFAEAHNNLAAAQLHARGGCQVVVPHCHQRLQGRRLHHLINWIAVGIVSFHG